MSYEPPNHPRCKIVVCDDRCAINMSTQSHKLSFNVKMQGWVCVLVLVISKDQRPHLGQSN